MPNYNVGSRPTITAVFVDIDDEPTDPASITFSVRAPDGTIETDTEDAAANPEVGVWKWTIPTAFDQRGIWLVRVAATEGLEAADEVAMYVADSAFD